VNCAKPESAFRCTKLRAGSYCSSVEEGLEWRVAKEGCEKLEEESLRGGGSKAEQREGRQSRTGTIGWEHMIGNS